MQWQFGGFEKIFTKKEKKKEKGADLAKRS